jgi:hypothetical protein
MDITRRESSGATWQGGEQMSEREKIRKRLKEDGIEFLLVQFVDIHGAAN